MTHRWKYQTNKCDFDCYFYVLENVNRVLFAGYVPYDFFMGRELNPRIGILDLKFLCELRPGLIGWILLDLCFLTEAYQQNGSITPAMVLVVSFHACYVIDALWFEVSLVHNFHQLVMEIFFLRQLVTWFGFVNWKEFSGTFLKLTHESIKCLRNAVVEEQSPDVRIEMLDDQKRNQWDAVNCVLNGK